MRKKVRIYITLKKSVLDTQGKAIENVLTKDLGFDQVEKTRQGKLIEFYLKDNFKGNISDIVDQMCDKLLVNKVIEEYSFEIF